MYNTVYFGVACSGHWLFFFFFYIYLVPPSSKTLYKDVYYWSIYYHPPIHPSFHKSILPIHSPMHIFIPVFSLFPRVIPISDVPSVSLQLPCDISPLLPALFAPLIAPHPISCWPETDTRNNAKIFSVCFIIFTDCSKLPLVCSGLYIYWYESLNFLNTTAYSKGLTSFFVLLMSEIWISKTRL